MQVLNIYKLDLEVLETLKNEYEKRKIEEICTQSDDCKVVLYRKISDKYFKVKIMRDGTVKKSEITKKDYKINAKEKKGSYIIKKKIIPLKNNSIITIHKNDITLETDSSLIKDRFKNYIQSNIKHNSTFNVYKDYDGEDDSIYKVFKKLKNMESIDMKSILESNKTIDDLVRIKLYQQYVELEKSRVNLFKDSLGLANNISSYRKKLYTVVTLIKLYRKILDEELSVKVIDNLDYLLEKTDFIDKLRSLRGELKTYKNCLDSSEFMNFLKKEDDEITKRVEEFMDFLQTREYAIILKQLEILIREKDSSDKIYPDSKKAVKKMLKKRYKKSIKSMNNYIECGDRDSFLKMHRKLERLFIINREFSLLFEDDVYYQRKKILAKIRKNINRYLKLEESGSIVKESLEGDAFECIINSHTTSKVKLLKRVKKGIKNLQKSKKLFVS